MIRFIVCTLSNKGVVFKGISDRSPRTSELAVSSCRFLKKLSKSYGGLARRTITRHYMCRKLAIPQSSEDTHAASSRGIDFCERSTTRYTHIAKAKFVDDQSRQAHGNFRQQLALPHPPYRTAPRLASATLSAQLSLLCGVVSRSAHPRVVSGGGGERASELAMQPMLSLWAVRENR